MKSAFSAHRHYRAEWSRVCLGDNVCQVCGKPRAVYFVENYRISELKGILQSSSASYAAVLSKTAKVFHFKTFR